MKALSLAVMALFVASAAVADPAASETIAPPNCKKPIVKTQVRKADGDNDFMEAAEAYKACMDAYVETQNELAHGHTAAANAAVDTFNAFVKETDEKKGTP